MIVLLLRVSFEGFPNVGSRDVDENVDLRQFRGCSGVCGIQLESAGVKALRTQRRGMFFELFEGACSKNRMRARPCDFLSDSEPDPSARTNDQSGLSSE